MNTGTCRMTGAIIRNQTISAVEMNTGTCRISVHSECSSPNGSVAKWRYTGYVMYSSGKSNAVLSSTSRGARRGAANKDDDAEAHRRHREDAARISS